MGPRKFLPKEICKFVSQRICRSPYFGPIIITI